MKKGVRTSKRWGERLNSRGRRDVPIWEKFDVEESTDKRIYLPEIQMRKEDVAYIQEAARRHEVSCSCQLETILSRAFFGFMLKEPLLAFNQKGARRHKMPYKKDVLQKRPKYTVHPSFVRLLEKYAKKREVSIGLLFCEIMMMYKKRFPIFLSVVALTNPLTPPFLELCKKYKMQNVEIKSQKNTFKES